MLGDEAVENLSVSVKSLPPLLSLSAAIFLVCLASIRMANSTVPGCDESLLYQLLFATAETVWSVSSLRTGITESVSDTVARKERVVERIGALGKWEPRLNSDNPGEEGLPLERRVWLQPLEPGEEDGAAAVAGSV